MPVLTRLRRPGTRKAGAVALTVAIALLIAACGRYPESVFQRHTEVNRDVDFLFKLLLWFGTGVFVIVEGILVMTLIKFRKRPGQAEPKHVHGNTALEITWTVIPILILVVIAVPTVRTIFTTQAKARADALQVEVIGHQWWWEFRYPQYNVVTANELYLPIGRTVNFTLHSADVIHSFWVPALAGKRDVVSNHTNYLWYTPDSTTPNVFNGACVEYCGTNHANMRFKAFVVSPADFESWAKNQAADAVGSAAPTPGAAATTAPAPSAKLASTTATKTPAAPSAAPNTASSAASSAAPVQVAQAGFIAYPRDSVPKYAVPETPLPAGLTFDDNLKGDPANGAKWMISPGGCIACHSIKGNPMMVGQIGPNLTHIASRTTIGAGLYPNDARHLARWIKNARLMKPDVIMPTLGQGQYDPTLKTTMKAPLGLTDQQIADIVAYLQTLK